MTDKTQTKESRYRAARLAKGDRLKPVWMTPETLRTLESLKATGANLETTVAAALAVLSKWNSQHD